MEGEGKGKTGGEGTEGAGRRRRGGKVEGISGRGGEGEGWEWKSRPTVILEVGGSAPMEYPEIRIKVHIPTQN